MINKVLNTYSDYLAPSPIDHSCVDYGHTFSKIIEMVPDADIMHGEAVNVDGFLCLVIAKRRGIISQTVLNRVFGVMKSIGLPTIHEGVELSLMVKVREGRISRVFQVFKVTKKRYQYVD